MRHRLVTAIVTVVALTAITGCTSGFTGTDIRSDTPYQPPPLRDTRAVAPSIGALTGPTLAVLSQSGGANIAFSPTLLASQLAVLHAGASQLTADELRDVLTSTPPGTPVPGVDDPAAAAASSTKVLTGRNGARRSAQRSGNVLVEQHAALWLQRGTTVSDTFVNRAAQTLDTGVRTTDFRSNPETSRQAINRWANTTSVGLVGELVPRGFIDTTTQMVSAGFTTMAGPWLHPFSPDVTTDGPFTTTAGITTSVPMMKLFAPSGLSHGTGDGWEAVELPLLGRELSMTLVVPDSPDPDATDALFGPALVADVMSSLQRQPVTVTMPKFAFTSTSSLAPAVAGVGAASVLDPLNANFDRLAPQQNLFLDDIVQQVFVAADEQGAAANAATVVDGPPSAPGPSAVVDVDKPFLVLVTDRPTGLVIVAGRVGDPRR